ncbi:unnamed protein product [Candidula unifasciata]|uniref:AN1-type domain-containing protein n=1 Tax=Candidula unifasciata TaxID=100452 RepID=A0A8S4A6D9_9EUPU|nr:unnamed protein product [Candidula unifasciata]
MELPHLGKNCSFPSCNQLDFLPFQCDGCGQTFCLQHRSRDQHTCIVEPERIPTSHASEKYSCSVPYCEKEELAQIVCHHCGLNVCLSHRLQEDHNCIKLPPKRPNVSKTSEHVQQLLAQKEIKPRTKPTNPKAIQMAAKVALMKLKGKAVGDQGIPQDERVYFNVVLPLESKKSSLPLFFSKVWTIGKIVDVIAERASLPNSNNTGAVQKLRLFHGDLGTKLPTDRQLSELMADGQLCLHNGSMLVLESVSDNVDMLKNFQAYKV